MSQWVKAVVSKLDYRRLIPGTYMVDWEKWLPQRVSDLHAQTYLHTYTHPHTHTHTLTNTRVNKTNVRKNFKKWNKKKE